MKRLFWTNKSTTLRLVFLSMTLVLLSFISIVVSNTSQAANVKTTSVDATESVNSNVTITNDDILQIIAHLRS